MNEDSWSKGTVYWRISAFTQHFVLPLKYKVHVRFFKYARNYNIGAIVTGVSETLCFQIGKLWEFVPRFLVCEIKVDRGA